MIYAEKGNKVRQITESEIQRFVEQGYQITDGRGTVLKETVPTDVATLRLAYVKNEETVKALNAKIAELEAEIRELKSQPTKKSEGEDAQVAPKRTRKTEKTED